jgi:hypothetical protein
MILEATRQAAEDGFLFPPLQTVLAMQDSPNAFGIIRKALRGKSGEVVVRLSVGDK